MLALLSARLIDQLQPYHKGAGFRAYTLGIPRDSTTTTSTAELILHVDVVNPKVRVFLGDSAGDEVMTADFDGVSGDVKPGTDIMGFTITDSRRQLVTDAAFPGVRHGEEPARRKFRFVAVPVRAEHGPEVQAAGLAWVNTRQAARPPNGCRINP
jgi:hypothetical protein